MLFTKLTDIERHRDNSHWHEGGQSAGEDDIRLPADVMDEDRRNHDNGKIPHPMTGNRNGSTAGTSLER